jgi:hypothetical protein
MDRDEALKRRAELIEARTVDHIHRAKRMVVDMFGTKEAKEQSALAMQLATAMIHLEAAELNAASLRRIAKVIDENED